MKLILGDDVHKKSIFALSLDPSSMDLTSVEALSNSIRRAGGFLCPCAPNALINAVVQALRALVDDIEEIRGKVENTLEALIAYGDFLEHREISEEGSEGGILLYCAPPSYVPRQTGSVLLVGIAEDNGSSLPDSERFKVKYINHTRRIENETIGGLASDLRQLDLVELSQDTWLKTPIQETSEEHLSRLRGILCKAPQSGEVQGLRLLDSASSPRYYPGRWVEPSSQSGQFVARRKQLYGAALWCFIEMKNGLSQRFIDFPLLPSKWRGYDQAWQLQAAIDAQQGRPQRYRLRSGLKNKVIVDFFSPVPAWAQRRWDAIGEPVERMGCLFSYTFTNKEIEEEIKFAQERLWLDEVPENIKW